MRDANHVAHQLANFSFGLKSVVSWEGEPPGFLETFVLDDVTLLDLKYNASYGFPQFFLLLASIRSSVIIQLAHCNERMAKNCFKKSSILRNNITDSTIFVNKNYPWQISSLFLLY
jgi:hypothetical protein